MNGGRGSQKCLERTSVADTTRINISEMLQSRAVKWETGMENIAGRRVA
jgi:hypothetical protein